MASSKINGITQIIKATELSLSESKDLKTELEKLTKTLKDSLVIENNEL